MAYSISMLGNRGGSDLWNPVATAMGETAPTTETPVQQGSEVVQDQADQAQASAQNQTSMLQDAPVSGSGNLTPITDPERLAEIQKMQEAARAAQEPTAPEVKAASDYMSADATVLGQLEKYFASDNPILQLAEAKARDQAQASGMLSSSMAEGAARRAVFEQAGDWAKTDTQGFQSLLGQQQQAEYQLGQTKYEGDITSKLQKEQGQITLGIQKDQQSFDMELTKYQNSEENKRLADQIAADQGMNTEQVQAQIKMNADKITADLSITDAQLANQMAIDMMKVDSSNQQAYVDAMKDLTYGYNENVASIMSLPDDQMSAAVKQQMIKELKEEYQGQSAMFASVWGAGVEVDGVMIGGGGSNANTTNPNDPNAPGAGADPVNNPPPAGAGAAADPYEKWQYDKFIASFATPEDFFNAAGATLTPTQEEALKNGYQEYYNRQSSVAGANWENNGQVTPIKTFGEWATATTNNSGLFGMRSALVSTLGISPYDEIVRKGADGGDWI